VLEEKQEGSEGAYRNFNFNPIFLSFYPHKLNFCYEGYRRVTKLLIEEVIA